MEILSKIFNSPARVKIMRLFLLNPDQSFKNKDITKRSRVSLVNVNKELRLLSAVDFIKKKKNEWFFNPLFIYKKEFENLLINTEIINKIEILNNFKKIGKLKLLILAGIFIKEKDSRADLLIVGDKLKKNKLEEQIKKIEAEIGTELVYAVFDTQEFIYRLNMYDKLIRDILDFRHEVLWETKELSTSTFKKV